MRSPLRWRTELRADGVWEPLAPRLAGLLLPLGMTNPIERVYEVRQRMNALKGSLQPLLSLGLLAVAGSLHQSAQNALLQRFSNKTTAVVTNVPGPSEPLVLCGAHRADRVMVAGDWRVVDGLPVGLDIAQLRAAHGAAAKHFL